MDMRMLKESFWLAKFWVLPSVPGFRWNVIERTKRCLNLWNWELSRSEGIVRVLCCNVAHFHVITTSPFEWRSVRSGIVHCIIIHRGVGFDSGVERRTGGEAAFWSSFDVTECEWWSDLHIDSNLGVSVTGYEVRWFELLWLIPLTTCWSQALLFMKGFRSIDRSVEWFTEFFFDERSGSFCGFRPMFKARVFLGWCAKILDP